MAANYQNKPVSELVHEFNDKCLALKRLGTNGATLNWDENPDEMPSTFLKRPATKKAIDDLQRKVRAEPYNFTSGLPEDYIEFLRITNGIYADKDEADNGAEIFRPVSKVKLEEVMEYTGEMLKIEFDGALSDAINWPEQSYALQLGAGGDEGTQHILAPSLVKTITEGLKKAHSKVSGGDKKKIEELAATAGGSVAQLTDAKTIILRTYHWDTEVGIFFSFKHLLGQYIQDMDEEGDDEGGDDEDDDDGDDDGSENEDKHSLAILETAHNKRKNIPEGKPDALQGLKFLFTGTLDLLDRNTAKKTVEEHGGSVITNLEKTDYIVLGTNCGPKKLDTIKEKNLTTISEEAFFQLLEGKKPNTESQDKLDKAIAKNIAVRPSQQQKAEPESKGKKGSKAPAASSKAEGASSSSAGNPRKQQAQGKPNALQGKKLLFTGTLETLDRATAKETAEAHGAKVITKLADTDLIVLGVNAGPKKIAEIEEKMLTTCTEAEFLGMLKGDAGEEVEAAMDEEEEEEKGEKKTTGRKRATTASAAGRGRGGKKAKA